MPKPLREELKTGLHYMTSTWAKEREKGRLETRNLHRQATMELIIRRSITPKQVLIQKKHVRFG